MKNFSVLFATLVITFFSWSCSSEVTSDENGDQIRIEIKTDSDKLEEELEKGMEELEKGMEELEDGLGDMSGGLQEGLEEMSSGLSKMLKNIKVEINNDGPGAADFRELKALLPARLLRMERVAHSGERSGIKGLQVAIAEAEYEDEGRWLEVVIIDGGGWPIAGLAEAGWSMVEVDKEDRNGYERTTTFDGHKAFEKYNKKWEEGELAVMIEDRFIVAIKGKGIDGDDLRRVWRRLDLEDELTDARFAR